MHDVFYAAAVLAVAHFTVLGTRLARAMIAETHLRAEVDRVWLERERRKEERGYE